MLFFISTAQAFTPYDYSEVEQHIKKAEAYRQFRDLEYYPEYPLSGYQKAATGKVATGVLPVQDHKSQVIWGIVVFDINIDTLYAAVNEELKHIDATPVDYTVLIKGKACQDKRQVLMHLPVPLLSDRWWVTTHSINPNIRAQSQGSVLEVSWEGIEDVDSLVLDQETKNIIDNSVYVSFNKGGWTFIKLDETHTLIEYFSWSDPGGSIPESLLSYVSSFTSSGIKDIFIAMETYAKNNEPGCNY